jgi:hypothetical protein
MRFSMIVAERWRAVTVRAWKVVLSIALKLSSFDVLKSRVHS